MTELVFRSLEEIQFLPNAYFFRNQTFESDIHTCDMYDMYVGSQNAIYKVRIVPLILYLTNRVENNDLNHRLFVTE